MNRIIYYLIITLFITACGSNVKSPQLGTDVMHKSVQLNTDVQVHDIFSPPLASRTYVYPSIIAYEIIATFDSLYPSLTNSLNNFIELGI